MYSNLDDNNDDHDLAIWIACKKFEEMYPKETQPAWLKYCMSMKVSKKQNKNWAIQMVLLPKPKLKQNQYWHWEDDGIPLLIEVDSITEKKSIVICGGPAIDLEVFFEVEVNLSTEMAKVLRNIDPNKLDGTKYEINRLN